MLLKLLKSKVHRAVITDANLNYEGSITLAKDIMDAAGFYENEEVQVWNVTNGNRLATYVMAPAEAGSGIICMNGAAAHLMKAGDIIIVASYAWVDKKEAVKHKPIKVIMAEGNKIKTIKHT